MMSDLRLRLRARGERLCKRPVAWLAAAGVTPNGLTLFGGIVAASAAWPAAVGHFPLAGGLFLAGSLLDALDGPLARRRHAESRFGAVLDACMDRLGEGALLAGLCVHFASVSRPLWVGIAAMAMLASFLTSYLRAWGERFGMAMEGDWLTRPERVLVLGVGLIFGVPETALALVLGLALVAVGMRLWRFARC